MNKKVLVTGGSGYIGSWVVQFLLEKGYLVRLTMRDLSKKEKIEYLLEFADKSPGTLELWEADLMKNNSFDEATKDCEVVIHIASPFKFKFKDAKKELIDPALIGTKNVLSAANKSGTVKKIVLTSSLAAIYGDNIDMKEQGLNEFTEQHFNQTSSIKHQPYYFSKLIAEKEAWKIYKEQKQWELVVINPSFVMGPPLTKVSNSGSIQFMKDMLNGKYYMGAPELIFGFVDVRDVAKAHILAFENDASKGRHILVERVMNVYELSRIIKQKYEKKYKLPLFKVPKFMLYLTGWMFGLSLKYIKRNVGYPLMLNASKSKESLGLKYTSIEKTLEDMIEQMIKLNIVE